MNWDEIWQNDVSDALSAGPSTRSRLRLMLELIERYGSRGGSLLDVGCGRGELLAQVAKTGRFASLSGVDISEVPLADAHRFVPDAELQVLDVCTAPLPRRFEVITCLMTLDLVPDERAAARNLSTMLEPGGHLLVVVQHLKEYSSDLDRRFGVRRHDRASLEALMTEHGLEPVELFSWGFPLFSAYYRLLSARAPEALGTSRVRSRAFRAVSAGLVTAFRADDLFKWTGRGRILFGVFKQR